MFSDILGVHPLDTSSTTPVITAKMSLDTAKLPQVFGVGAGGQNQVWLRTRGPEKEKGERRQEVYSGRGPDLTAETEGRPSPGIFITTPAPFLTFKEPLSQLSIPGPYQNHTKWPGAGCLFRHCQTARG